MKRTVENIVRILWMITLAVLWTLPILGQSVTEIQIENKALMQYKLLDGFPLSIESNLVSFVVKNTGKLYVQKTVFPAAALPGETVTFKIVVGNIGTATLANIRVIDTLPIAFSLVSVNQGKVQGSIVSRTWSNLDAGSMDTLIIVARVLSSVQQGSILSNSAYGSDSVGTKVVSSTTLTVTTMSHFVITNSAVPNPVGAGDTLTYTLHYGNDGNATGTGVHIYDAVPNGTQFVSASTNGIVTSGVVSWDVGTLTAGTFGTVQLNVHIPSGMPNRSRILSTGMLNANGGVSISSNQDTTVVNGILPGRIRLAPNPRLIIGNGIDKSILTVTVTDTLGRPVPDGTPITITTTAGKFSNGQQIIVLSTINGTASTSLIADMVRNYITTAIAAATAGTIGVGTVTDFVTIIFYPGAITGMVLDNRTGRAVDGAVAEVRSSNGQIIGVDTTKAGNPYLVPVAKTDTFRTRVTAIDAFGNPTVSSASVFVAVPGVGGIPPLQNGNSISGTIYNLATGRRLATAGLLISRFNPSGALADTVRTDQIGNYVFNKVSAGNSTIELITQIDTARVSVGNLTDGEFVINTNLGIISPRPELQITKTASADTVMAGDSVRYVIRFQNSGNVVLNNVVIRDSIPASLNIVSISDHAQHTGNVISSTVVSLFAGAMDSLWIIVKLRSDLANRFTIVNTASAESDQTPIQYATHAIVTKVVVSDRSCSIALSSTPSLIIGNGIQSSVIEAYLSDTLGHPKPDGTPVTFSTTKGFFLNGQNTIIVPTLNGRAVDSVRALIVNNSIDTSFVTVSVNDQEVCSASNTIMVIFYPGAITGNVHNWQTQQPVENALVQVNSSANVLVGSTRTKADGGYLVPVPKTDRYRVTILTTNAFGEPSTATMYVPVVVPGTGGNPPTIGNNHINGSIYYLVSNRPIPAAGIRVMLKPITASMSAKRHYSKTLVSTASTDSTLTDSTGTYFFENISVGTYEVTISHPWIQGKDTVQNIVGGELVVDVNIPVVLNPSLTFNKQGPAQVNSGDTALYTITAGNSGTLSTTNTVIIDTLDTYMNFTSASSPGTYEPVGHRIIWNVGTLPTGSQLHYSVQVAFADTISATVTARNRASITSNEIIPMSTQIFTHVNAAHPELRITKTVSADTVLAGDSIRYVLRFQNSGNTVLKKVVVRDTVPASLTISAVSGNALRNGNVISSTVDSMSVGAIDSIWITARLRSGLPNRFIIVNTASAESDRTPSQNASRQIVTKVIVPDRSCRVSLRTTPSFVIGNGINASVIEAFLSDTLGRPKPDGTPLTFNVTNGFFSNGQSTIVVPTLNGHAVDSVRALIVGSTIDTTFVNVSAGDPEVCSASNTIIVVFYPGAICGIVHNGQTGQPTANALVRVYSSAGQLVGSMQTVADGKYLIPVPKTDRYHVAITTTNIFGGTSTTTMEVTVNVPGTGGNSPVSGNNQIHGSLFYFASNRPIPAAGIKLLLSPIATNVSAKQRHLDTSVLLTPIDSTVTDSTGAYLFENIPAGIYEVAISHSSIQGKDTVQNVGGGELLIDVNIAVVLNPSLSFSKQGPAQVNSGDTAVYTITARNSGMLSMTNTLIIDTLDARMNFIDASSPGSYESAGHRVVWNTGMLLAGSQLQYTVRVAFSDTLRTTFTARNSASITSNEIISTSTQTFTRVYIPSRLQIWKTSSISSAQPGDTVTYTIFVENVAGATSDSIRVSDELPKQVRFLASAPLAQYDSSAHQLRWFIDSLLVGQRWQVAVRTIVRSDLPAGEVKYTNKADLVWRDSSITSSADSRSHAQVTTVVSYLQVSKQALHKIVDIGDFAGYIVRITNTSITSEARNVILADRIPFGFSYVTGSSVLGSVRVVDPTGRQELRWHLADSLPPNTTLTFSYRLVVGAGGIEGTGVNTAQAFANTSTGNTLVSASVSEQIEVRRGVFTEHGLIVGKVFYDDNRNAAQDEGEEGVKNIELMMEDGTRIITGDDGKYSLPDVPPGQHVIKVRQHTLPEGVVLLPGYGAFAHDPSSRFVKLTEGNIARADFYLARKAVPFDTVIGRRQIDSVSVGDSVARSTNPHDFKGKKGNQHSVDGESIQNDGAAATTRSTSVTKKIGQKH